MAEVSITLDGRQHGEIPIDYAEVEISRHAYHDGDDEYLVNGRHAYASRMSSNCSRKPGWANAPIPSSARG